MNDYFMKKYTNYRTPSFVKKVVRPSNIWTEAYITEAMALYSIYPADRYYLCQRMGGLPQWGFHRGTTTRNADNYRASQIYLDLYNILILKNTTENESQYEYAGQYSTNKRLVVDRCYPDEMPIFAKMGKLANKYFDKMWNMRIYP